MITFTLRIDGRSINLIPKTEWVKLKDTQKLFLYKEKAYEVLLGTVMDDERILDIDKFLGQRMPLDQYILLFDREFMKKYGVFL